MAKLVAKVYGDALFELACETDSVDVYREEAKGVASVLEQNPDIAVLMAHPKIVKEEKIRMLKTIFGGRIQDEIIGLMKMVIEKNHFSDMPEILSYFEHQVMEYKNIGKAFVTTPMPLTDEQKEQVEKRLLETTDYVSFQMEYSVDADLIGGMVIRIGDRVVDSSIRSRISELARELSKIQLKVGECAP